MSTVAPDRAKRRSREVVPAVCLFLAGLATLALAAYPIYVIRPFREQRPVPLGRALWVLMHDKPILLLLFTVITVLAVVVWHRAGWVAKIFLAPAIGLSLIAVAGAWFNPYEQMMFHAYGAPLYVPVQQAGIDPNDMVIAVTLGGESRAYPIREMGYHHVVNDRLHQLPIVVTY